MSEWTFLVLGLLLGIPLSIFANVATPWVKSAIEESVFSSRRKRLERLLHQYGRIKSYNNDRTLLITELLRQLTAGIMAIFLFGIFGVLSVAIMVYDADPLFQEIVLTSKSGLFVSLLFICFMLTIPLVGLYNDALSIIIDTLDFPSYTEKVKIKITRLGGNPEDLDKE